MAADTQAAKVQGPDTPGNPMLAVINPSGSSGLVKNVKAGANNTAAAALAVNLVAVVGRTNYLKGFRIEGLGATAATVVDASFVGLAGSAPHFRINVPANVGQEITPVQVDFSEPFPASGPNVAITLNVPSFGAGNTEVGATVWGFDM